MFGSFSYLKKAREREINVDKSKKKKGSVIWKQTIINKDSVKKKRKKEKRVGFNEQRFFPFSVSRRKKKFIKLYRRVLFIDKIYSFLSSDISIIIIDLSIPKHRNRLLFIFGIYIYIFKKQLFLKL